MARDVLTIHFLCSKNKINIDDAHAACCLSLISFLLEIGENRQRAS